MAVNQTLWLDQNALRVGGNQLVATNNGVGIGTAFVFGALTAAGVNGSTAATFFGNVGIGTGNPTSNFSVAGNASIDSGLVMGPGTATAAPLRFTAGTNLSTAAAGTFEYDGVAPYFTPAAGQRGVLPGRQYYSLATNLTGQITIANTGQTATFTAATPTVVTVASPPNNGTIVTFTTSSTLPSGIDANRQYFVRNQSGGTFNISSTRTGALLGASSTGTGTQTAVFHCSIGNVGCNLNANTRYAYEIQTTVLKSAVNAATVQYALTQDTGTLNWHSYMVLSMNAANFLTPTAPTMMTNIISSGFTTPVSVTAASAAAAVYYPLLIKGEIDVGATAVTNLNFCIGFTQAPTTSQFNAGTYLYIYPISSTGSAINTSVGSWA